LTITYVGGLAESRFIKELLEIVKDDTRLSLEIAGYGNLSNLVEKNDEKYKNIKFHGQITYSKSLELNRESDILIAMYNPNLKNNQYSAPNKVYEAMKFGKPIIVARGTGVDQLVSKEKIGYISKYKTKDLIKVKKNIINNTD